MKGHRSTQMNGSLSERSPGADFSACRRYDKTDRMIKHGATAKTIRKVKSPESLEFLETIRKKRQSTKAVEIAIADFYDSLTDEYAEEQAGWGEFALGEFLIRNDFRSNVRFGS